MWPATGIGADALVQVTCWEIKAQTLRKNRLLRIGPELYQEEQQRVEERFAKAAELDKALSGVGGQGDSGVSTRLFGTLLSWLADHESDVFFVGAANDIRWLPPEFTRAERLDGLFFLDLPGGDDKAGIWRMHRSAFNLPNEMELPDDSGWTGAEIRSCCRLAALLETSLVEAAKLVAPVAVTAAETVDALRTWASGRCVDAARPGLYRRETTGKSRRRIERDADNN